MYITKKTKANLGTPLPISLRWLESFDNELSALAVNILYLSQGSRAGQITLQRPNSDQLLTYSLGDGILGAIMSPCKCGSIVEAVVGYRGVRFLKL